MAIFTVQGIEFEADLTSDPTDAAMTVRSVPRPYEVEFPSRESPRDVVESLTAASAHPLVLADTRVLSTHLDGLPDFDPASVLPVESTERFKSVDGALSVLRFLDERRMGRGSLLVVVGGGIVQDVGAFSACVYKRGVPWAYVPTTLLAQADSCIGAKSGLNFNGAKNLVGVFSAPRRVTIHTGFLGTLSEDDIVSGLGEIYRLSIIGGPRSLAIFEAHVVNATSYSAPDLEVLVRLALTIKRSVIERDEYELDLRRSMNFGHTVGHALEAITDHAIPHGTAVAIGVLVESQMSLDQGVLPEADWQRLLHLGRPLIKAAVRARLAEVNFDLLLQVLFQDKKAEGAVLKLVIPERVGSIRFENLPLEPETVPRIRGAVHAVLDQL
ncbi:MAG: 3-dehydroquinate synthase [Acidimicrobiales bacterium]